MLLGSYFTIYIYLHEFNSFICFSVDDKHHKSAGALEERNSILKWYYSIYPLFGYCCVGAEMFYVLLYASFYFPSQTVDVLCFYVSLPACVIKNIINIVQLCDAAKILASRDASAFNAEHIK
jgi:CDP-diacylglycerol--inositol 3-phosphatidyltransferase